MKKLTRKKAIELCIELWEWLAKTGKKKEEWPKWNEFDSSISNDCWFCEYDWQQLNRYGAIQRIAECFYCPLKKQVGHCATKTYYKNWDKAKTSKTRKKYAALFLEQIKSIPIRKSK